MESNLKHRIFRICFLHMFGVSNPFFQIHLSETLQLFALITQARAGDLKLMDLAEGKGPTGQLFIGREWR